MLPKRDRHPDLPPARVQIPKSVLRAMCTSLVLVAASVLAMAGLFIWERTRDHETYVYVVDQNGTMITRVVAHSQWSPGNADWADAAMRWVEQVRSRSLDPKEYKKQLKRLSLTTDAPLWASVDKWMKEHPPKLTEAIDVEIQNAQIDSQDANQATVKVWWKEWTRPASGGLMNEQRGLVTVHLAKGPPREEQEIDVHNGDGIYVTGFNFNPVRKLAKNEEKN